MSDTYPGPDILNDLVVAADRFRRFDDPIDVNLVGQAALEIRDLRHVIAKLRAALEHSTGCATRTSDDPHDTGTSCTCGAMDLARLSAIALRAPDPGHVPKRLYGPRFGSWYRQSEPTDSRKMTYGT